MLSGHDAKLTGFSTALRAHLDKIERMPQGLPLTPEQEAECECAKQGEATLSTDDILRSLGEMAIAEEPAAAIE